MKKPRYTLIIAFHGRGLLVETFTTKREANSYKSIIDHTVQAAWLEDKVTGVHDFWKKGN